MREKLNAHALYLKGPDISPAITVVLFAHAKEEDLTLRHMGYLFVNMVLKGFRSDLGRL